MDQIKRMQQLAGINEVKVRLNTPNHLEKLKQLETQIEQTEDITTKVNLAIEAVQLVLPIWYYYFPGDKRIENILQAAKLRKNTASSRDAAINIAEKIMGTDNDYYEEEGDDNLTSGDYAAADVAYAAMTAAGSADNDSYADANAHYAARSAISATKHHFDIYKDELTKYNN